MSNILSNEKSFKSLVAFGVSASIDKFVYRSPNIKNTLILAGVAGASNYFASTLQELSIIPTISIAETYNSENINIKTIEQRLIELSLGIGSAYFANTVVLKNMRPNLPIQDILFIFGGSSVISEYLTDYMFSKKLSYLA